MVEIPNHNVVEAVYFEQRQKKDLRRALLTTLIALIVVAALTIILALFIFPLEKINGDNLSPKLDNNDIVLCMKQPSYTRGDLVCIAYGDFTLIKRIVAVEGDEISFDNENRLYVNKTLVHEDNYLINDKSGDYENIYPIQVPDSCYFVLSDNREIMTDSRSPLFGSVKQEYVVGKVLFRFWPLDKLSVVS